MNEDDSLNILNTWLRGNTLFCAKAERLPQLLSKITRSVRLRDIVYKINSCYMSKIVNTIYVHIYLNS